MKKPDLELHIVPNGEGGLVRVWQPRGSKFRPEKVVSCMPGWVIEEIVHLDEPELPPPVVLPAAGTFVTIEVGWPK